MVIYLEIIGHELSYANQYKYSTNLKYLLSALKNGFRLKVWW